MPETKKMIKKLHKIKNEMNHLIRQLNNIDGLIIDVEVLKVKAEGKPAAIHGLEITVMKEIY
jgi:hypothetical protein